MLQTWVPPVAALAYAGLLFAVAYLGDKRDNVFRFQRWSGSRGKGMACTQTMVCRVHAQLVTFTSRSTLRRAR